MSKRLIALAALLVAPLSCPVPAAGQDTSPGPERNSQFWMPQLLPSPLDVAGLSRQGPYVPDYTLKVWVAQPSAAEKSIDGKQTAALYERVRDHMNQARLGVPEDRINFFKPRWANNPPIIGWSGMVYGVKPIKGGYAVTLRILAVDLNNSRDILHLYEHYTIVGGKVTYRGYTEPSPHLR